jgi:hypothetical protein
VALLVDGVIEHRRLRPCCSEILETHSLHGQYRGINHLAARATSHGREEPISSGPRTEKGSGLSLGGRNIQKMTHERPRTLARVVPDLSGRTGLAVGGMGRDYVVPREQGGFVRVGVSTG